MAHNILAYAAKVLKELHESQVIAGKGAGTIVAQAHPKELLIVLNYREAVGLPCCPRP